MIQRTVIVGGTLHSVGFAIQSRANVLGVGAAGRDGGFVKC